MESAAIAYVCEKSSTKYIGVKSITDIVDGDIPTAEEFTKEFKVSFKFVTKFFRTKY